MSALIPSQQPTVLFSIYQNNTWTIRRLVVETIDPVTQRIILKIVGFLLHKGSESLKTPPYIGLYYKDYITVLILVRTSDRTSTWLQWQISFSFFAKLDDIYLHRIDWQREREVFLLNFLGHSVIPVLFYLHSAVYLNPTLKYFREFLLVSKTFPGFPSRGVQNCFLFKVKLLVLSILYSQSGKSGKAFTNK